MRTFFPEIDLQIYDAYYTRIPMFGQDDTYYTRIPSFGQENKRRQKLCSNWCLKNAVK